MWDTSSMVIHEKLTPFISVIYFDPLVFLNVIILCSRCYAVGQYFYYIWDMDVQRPEISYSDIMLVLFDVNIFVHNIYDCAHFFRIVQLLYVVSFNCKN